jgi:hypothetical protein
MPRGLCPHNEDLGPALGGGAAGQRLFEGYDLMIERTPEGSQRDPTVTPA